MKYKLFSNSHSLFVWAAVLLFLLAGSATAAIDGISGTGTGTPADPVTFDLTVKMNAISTADGGSVVFWGYADTSVPPSNANRPQYPGPTLIVEQGQTVEIILTNELELLTGATPNVSIVFPGQQVTATGGVSGLLTREAQTTDVPGTPEDESLVTYTFIATNPGTYMYHSGTRPELQVEMGLLGALIVRPAGFNPLNPTAYGPGTEYDREFLFLLSEMDPLIHETVFAYGPDAPELMETDALSDYFSKYWFMNGRTAPDNMGNAGESAGSLLLYQPYNSLPRMHPGERMLMRVIGGNREMHPFHHHGNHARVIARDGRLLDTGTGGPLAPGEDPDLSFEVFTINSVPGETVDAIFEWTGKGLNWDVYGVSDDPQFATDPPLPHDCTDLVDNETGVAPPDGYGDPGTDTPWEYCADHLKMFPTLLPQKLDLAFGGWYGGSPFLGSMGALPPGEGGLNPNGGFSYMWHSHTEKELTNFDIFPGGMLTMLIIEGWNVDID